VVLGQEHVLASFPGRVPAFDDRPWCPEHGTVPAPFVESVEADGCSCCGIEDLAAFVRTLWREDRLLAAESFAAMKRPWPPHEGPDYGYGIIVDADGSTLQGDMPGYVCHGRVDTQAGFAVVACASGCGGASWLGETALELMSGREPPPLEATAADAPLIDDGTGPPRWRPYVGRYRAHSPWLPTFAVAANAGVLTFGSDWLDGSDRVPLSELTDGLFALGTVPWTPERLLLDAEVAGRTHRATLSGTEYLRCGERLFV
jgi:hypothetical protein